MFDPYAIDLAQRVADGAADAASVLETACGTGVLTRRLRAALPAGTVVVATDLNQPMIDEARALVDMPGVEWRQADCTALPFDDGSFGAVACQFGMMFVPDKGAAIREARRVLIPGGLLAFNVWGSLEDNPYALLTHRTIAALFPGDPPNFYELPHGSHDADQWRDLLETNGFVDLELDWVDREAHSPTAAQFALGLARGTPMSNQIALRGGDFDQVVAALAPALERLGGSAPFRGSMRGLVVTARAA
jgi:SAM-dependent methyltransferase